jgi:hypothetical protein
VFGSWFRRQIPNSIACSFGAVRGVDLGEDLPNVEGAGAVADAELFGYLGVAVVNTTGAGRGGKVPNVCSVHEVTDIIDQHQTLILP